MIELSSEQQTLWNQVRNLWGMAQIKDRRVIMAALHPGYAGWDMQADLPHDREAAVSSVCDDTAQLTQYELEPLAVNIYAGTVGIVHYRYSAVLTPADAEPVSVRGKWSEVYLRQDGNWIMLSVSGAPD